MKQSGKYSFYFMPRVYYSYAFSFYGRYANGSKRLRVVGILCWWAMMIGQSLQRWRGHSMKPCSSYSHHHIHMFIATVGQRRRYKHESLTANPYPVPEGEIQAKREVSWPLKQCTLSTHHRSPLRNAQQDLQTISHRVKTTRNTRGLPKRG